MRKEQILEAGANLWPEITLKAVADAIGLKHTAILYYFPSSAALRDEIAAHAVRTGNSHVILQLLGEKHPAVADMSPAERIRHFNNV